LSAATRRQRENIFKHVLASAGNERLTDISRKHIVAGRERRASTPFQAKNFLDAMRGLFAWAVEREFVKANPVEGVKIARPKTKGFPAWTLDDLAAYRDRWTEGTRERHWLETILVTGLRRGDVVKLGRQHIKDGMARITTEKKQVTAYIPLDSEAVSALTTDLSGDLAFIVGKSGKPLTKESFGNYFREACRTAGINKSAHGLRKLAASLDAESGWTEAELKSKYAWTDSQMPSLYTREANREKAAKNAAHRTRGRDEVGTSIPSPTRKNSLT
jgi:integrase